MRLALPFLCMVLMGAGDERATRPALPPAVRQIVDLARAAPPELFADTIVRLVQGGRIPQRDLQVDLLEEAFSVAAAATEPVRLIAIPPTPPDTRAVYRAKASDLRLDALSLRSRILKELLTVDRVKARELFQQISRPAPDPRPCEDPLVVDASAYYEIAAAVAQSAFTAAEKEKEVHVQFLATLLAGARSPNEIEPFVHGLQSVELSPHQWELLLASLAGKLESIGADYRPFALSLPSLQSEIAGLTELARANGVPTDGLQRAFRKYVTTQLAASRCSPDFGPAAQDITTIPPLADEDMKPSKRNDTFKVEAYFQSEDSKQIGSALTRLRFVSSGGAPSEEDRTRTEWRNSLADFVRDFKQWNPPGSAVDAFHQRATVLRSLLQILQPGDDRDRMLSLCVSYLQSDVERQNPVEWLWQVKALLQDTGGDAPRMLTQFRASNDAGLALYAIMN